MQEIISIEEAKDRGLKRFFTGIPCKNGHLSERYVANKTCVICNYENSNEWKNNNHDLLLQSARKGYYKNREKILERSKEYRAKNPEKCKEREHFYYHKHRESNLIAMRNYYYNNKDKERERNKNYCEENKDAIRERHKKYREENRERLNKNQKEWVKNNKEKTRAYDSKRRCRKLKSKIHHTEEDIKELYKAQKGKCAYCKVKVGKKYHVDHIIPLSKGGDNSKHNIQICCPTCNLKKHAKDPIDFAQELGLLI